MPHYNFVICYEKDVPNIKDWFKDKKYSSLVPIDPQNIHKELLKINPVSVIFSSIQNRQTPLSLLYIARKMNIPTIAVEESIQMALNNGKVNNYMFPVDYIGFASEFEKEQSLKEGLQSGNIFITGWPFLHRPRTSSDKENLRKLWGIEEGQKVISITFPGLNAGTETESVRNSQLQICASLLSMDPKICLLIKPHPVESLNFINEWINENLNSSKKQVKLLDGNVLIHDVIIASDFMLNRGSSQTFFEALLNEIPVILLDVGIQNLFYQYAPNCVQKSATGVLKFINSYKKDEFDSYYSALLKNFLSFSPERSLDNVVELIEMAIRSGLVKINNFHDIMLFSFLNLSLPKLANDCYKKLEPSNTFLSQYKLLISNKKMSFDEWQNVLEEWKDTFYYSIVFCIFINNHDKTMFTKPIPKPLVEWIMIFPKKIHPIWFIETIEKLLLLISEDQIILKQYLNKISPFADESVRFKRLILSFK